MIITITSTIIMMNIVITITITSIITIITRMNMSRLHVVRSYCRPL